MKLKPRLIWLLAVVLCSVIVAANAQSLPAPNGDAPTWGWLAVAAFVVVLALVGAIHHSLRTRIEALEAHAKELTAASIELVVVKAVQPLHRELAELRVEMRYKKESRDDR